MSDAWVTFKKVQLPAHVYKDEPIGADEFGAEFTVKVVYAGCYAIYVRVRDYNRAVPRHRRRNATRHGSYVLLFRGAGGEDLLHQRVGADRGRPGEDAIGLGGDHATAASRQVAEERLPHRQPRALRGCARDRVQARGVHR